MISSLLGKKLGMTQVYDAQNVLVPVTVVEAGPCAVVQVKTTATDGYNAVQIGFSSKKSKNTSAAEKQHAAKAGLADAPRVLSEIRLTDAPTLKVGDIVLCKVAGNEYLHLVKAIQGQRLQIGNNRGGINGWISRGCIYGVAVRVEP